MAVTESEFGGKPFFRYSGVDCMTDVFSAESHVPWWGQEPISALAPDFKFEKVWYYPTEVEVKAQTVQRNRPMNELSHFALWVSLDAASGGTTYKILQTFYAESERQTRLWKQWNATNLAQIEWAWEEIAESWDKLLGNDLDSSYWSY